MGINVEYVGSAAVVATSLGVGVMSFMPENNDPMRMVDSLQLGIAAGGTLLGAGGMIMAGRKK